MLINRIIWQTNVGADLSRPPPIYRQREADKSAVGAINRPLRSLAYNEFIHPIRRFFEIHVTILFFHNRCRVSPYMGAGRNDPDASWRHSNTYFYTRGYTGDRQKRLAGGTAGGWHTDHSRQYLSSHAAARLRTDLLVRRTALLHALGRSHAHG